MWVLKEIQAGFTFYWYNAETHGITSEQITNLFIGISIIACTAMLLLISCYILLCKLIYGPTNNKSKG